MKINHASEREICCERFGMVTPGPRIMRGVVCHSFFGGSDSKSETASNAATDEGLAVTGRARGYKAGDFSDVNVTEVGAKGKLNLGVDLSTAKPGGDIIVNDPGLIESAFSELRNASANFSDTVAEVVNQSNTGAAALNAQVFDKLSELSTAKLTDGESTRDKTILYIIVAIVLGAVVYFWRK